MITQNKTTILVNSFNLQGKVSFDIERNKQFNKIKLRILENDFCKEISVNDNRCSFCFEINNPSIWSVEHPFLYHYELFIDDEKVEGTFAFRTLGHNKHNVLLNNLPIFVRGYIRGATAHEHSNNLGVSNKEFYRKNIVAAKEYGFNMVRFHSVVPDDDFFAVADEEGMLVHLELRDPHDIYNNLEEMISSKNELVPNSFIDHVIDSFYNHPSLAVYCIGNEIKGLEASKRSDEIGKYIKKRDPSRLFLDTCAWGKLNRSNIDIDVQHLSYFFPYGAHSDMFSNPKNIHTLKDEIMNLKEKESPFNVPLLAHEICHYTALRDFKGLKIKFESNNVKTPWWVDEELKLITLKGYDNIYDVMYRASKHFQYICWKEALQRVRQSSLLGGFHFLQFADTDVYENSNGVVDPFDDPSYLFPELFYRINGPIVITSDINKIYRHNQDVDIKISLSNYGEEKIDKAIFACSLLDKNKELYKYEQELEDVPFLNSDLLIVKLKLPKVDKSKELLFKVSLSTENKIIKNEYSLWVYPGYPTMTYRDFININNDKYLITDNIEKALTSLKSGKKTVLIYRNDWTRHLINKDMSNPKYAFKASWNRFKPVIWDRGTNFGGYVNDLFLNRYGFATSKYYDFNYSVISEDSDKIILDDFPIKVDSLIIGIDKCNRDRFDAYRGHYNLPELMPDRTLRNFSYMFELKVDNIPLLVCGLNLTHLDEKEPSSESIAHFILNYINSKDFDPKSNISLMDLEKYMSNCALKPVKERTMTEFWQLDNAPVESKEFWQDAIEYIGEKLNK